MPSSPLWLLPVAAAFYLRPAVLVRSPVLNMAEAPQKKDIAELKTRILNMMEEADGSAAPQGGKQDLHGTRLSRRLAAQKSKKTTAAEENARQAWVASMNDPSTAFGAEVPLPGREQEYESFMAQAGADEAAPSRDSAPAIDDETRRKSPGLTNNFLDASTSDFKKPFGAPANGAAPAQLEDGASKRRRMKLEASAAEASSVPPPIDEPAPPAAPAAPAAPASPAVVSKVLGDTPPAAAAFGEEKKEGGEKEEKAKMKAATVDEKVKAAVRLTAAEDERAKARASAVKSKAKAALRLARQRSGLKAEAAASEKREKRESAPGIPSAGGGVAARDVPSAAQPPSAAETAAEPPVVEEEEEEAVPAVPSADELFELGMGLLNMKDTPAPQSEDEPSTPSAPKIRAAQRALQSKKNPFGIVPDGTSGEPIGAQLTPRQGGLARRAALAANKDIFAGAADGSLPPPPPSEAGEQAPSRTRRVGLFNKERTAAEENARQAWVASMNDPSAAFGAESPLPGREQEYESFMAMGGAEGAVAPAAPPVDEETRRKSPGMKNNFLGMSGADFRRPFGAPAGAVPAQPDAPPDGSRPIERPRELTFHPALLRRRTAAHVPCSAPRLSSATARGIRRRGGAAGA
jgi:hypothetical protein